MYDGRYIEWVRGVDMHIKF